MSVAHDQLLQIHMILWLIQLTHFLASEMKINTEIEADLTPMQFFGYSSNMVGARLLKRCDV